MSNSGSIGSITPPTLGALQREIADLRRQIQEVRTARTLAASSVTTGNVIINGGTFSVIDADGHMVGLLGNFGDGVIGTGFWRSDGSAAFQVTPTFAAIYDKAGNPVVSDDFVHGSGLATPWVTGGVVLADTNTLNWPQTVNGAFTEIALGYYRVENPRLQWTIEHVADTSTTGELKLLVNGVQVGATQTVTSGFAFWDTVNVALPAGVAVNDLVPVSLQARRTSGTGTVYATTLRFSGDQSP